MAVSVETGRVAIAWEFDGSRFRLCWQEHGGPPVAAPERKGFGSVMIERALAAQIEGEVNIDFAKAGLICSIDAPLVAVEEGQAR
ncbi:MAG: hypothetical protein EHM67_08215 [Hyphomicrobiaceae bacterium]|nr:MAG: hypothetical protein EHM67_08215 [Hyphomicrobiaceae bacterium]